MKRSKREDKVRNEAERRLVWGAVDGVTGSDIHVAAVLLKVK